MSADSGGMQATSKTLMRANELPEDAPVPAVGIAGLALEKPVMVPIADGLA